MSETATTPIQQGDGHRVDECAGCGVPFGPAYPRAKGRPSHCVECCEFSHSVDERSLRRDQADGYPSEATRCE